MSSDLGFVEFEVGQIETAGEITFKKNVWRVCAV